MLFGAGVFGVYQNRYNIYDYIKLRDYTPPASIAKLAADDTLTTKSRKIFYVNRPVISDRQAFRQECLANSKPEQTIVLGCYNGVRIYIFKVDDPQLDGVEQVTAAHEMLHAAYDRLSSSQRKHIDELVMSEYKKLNDPRINGLADSYSKQEPGSVPNEMHSILGTEVGDLSPELESYYAQYFTNRQKVVAFANTYQQKFTDLKDAVDRLDADLALRKTEIDNLQNSLELQAQNLTSQKSQMDSMLAHGQIQAFNAQVPSYNQGVNSYNSGVQNLQNLIKTYNSLVEQRNQYAVEQQNLVQSLNSNLSTITGR